VQYVVVIWNDSGKEYIRGLFGPFPDRAAASWYCVNRSLLDPTYDIEPVIQPSPSEGTGT
jgi:hypothetical protein